MRNNILRALRTDASFSTRQVPQTFVYQHSSISALSDFVYEIATGQDVERDEEAVIARKVKAMNDMVTKYSANFPAPRRSIDCAQGQEVVLVTGTTGRLGCHILAQLVRDPSVRHVYALNRASARDVSQPEALLARQKSAFETWELDTSLLTSGKVTILASQYAEYKLGLSDAMYAEIETSVTTIIHNGKFFFCNVIYVLLMMECSLACRL
jgi:hypothetical protein